MNRRPGVPLGQLAAAAAVLTLPMAAVMGGLVLAGVVGLGAAVLAVPATALLTALLVRPYLADLLAVVAYIRDLARDMETPPPAPVVSRPAHPLMSAVGLLRRAWGERATGLKASLASNETIFDSLPDAVFLLAEQRRVVRANLAARRLFGRELADRDLAAVLRDPGLLDAVDRILGGAQATDVDFTLPVPVERNFRARLERLPRAVDGSVAVLALHDMTAIARTEQMRADFVANASHELRTPLSTLLGFVETLRGPARDDPVARDRFLAIMHEQASRMARLVADLLSLSRIELNEHTQPMGRVDLRTTLRSVANTLDLQAKARGMAIVLDMPETLPPVIGQADELAQVFQNLIDNATKYGRENSPIEVVARVVDEASGAVGRLPGGAVSVAVRDHGEGIAKEHLPRLTERFFRVDDARSRKLGGTGLGLAIVKHVVNRHRGVLHIDSTFGKGSIFTVYLPSAEEHLREAR